MVTSSIVFGVAHGSWIFLWSALPVILSTTVLGVLLAALYIIADRKLLAPISAYCD